MDSPLLSEIFSSRAEKVVVLISVTDTKGWRSHGHGVLINNSGSILTVSHLLYRNVSSEVVFLNNVGDEIEVLVNKMLFIAKIEYVNVAQDTALLQIVRAQKGDWTKIDFDYVNLASNISIGQNAILVSSSDTRNFLYTQGTVGSFTELDEEIGATNNSMESEYFPHVVVHNLHSIPGFSGSPVFDDEGDIIGLVHSADHLMTHLVHPIFLRQFFKQTQVATDGDIPGSSRRTDEKEKKKGEKRRRKEGKKN